MSDLTKKSGAEDMVLQFIEDKSTGIEVVSMEHVQISYPPHTHVDHYVIGIVTEGEIVWTKHPTFEGVELKHILTAKETGGSYSFLLVRIAPGKSILDHIHDPQLETHEVIAGKGTCINDGCEIEYFPGVISVMPSQVHHEVHAGEEGLYLFAKFMPALC